MASARRSSRLSLMASVTAANTSQNENDDEVGRQQAPTTSQTTKTKKSLRVLRVKNKIEEIMIDSDTSEEEDLARKKIKILSTSDSEHFSDNYDKMKNSATHSNSLPKREAKIKQEKQRENAPTKRKIAQRKNQMKKEPKLKLGVTPMEALRRKNIEERMQLFKDLKLDEANKELQEVVQLTKSIKPKYKSKVLIPKVQENLPPRKSLRLEGIKATEIEEGAPRPSFRYSAPPMFHSSGKNWGSDNRNTNENLPMLEVKLPKFSDEHTQNAITSCCDNFIDSKDSDTSMADMSLEDFKEAMNQITLTEDHKLKVVPSRIYSMAFHPTFNGTLLAAGCKSGAVGVWNASLEGKNHDDGLVTFRYHVSPTSCVSFGESEPNILYSTSYDGTLRRGDLQKQTFTLVHSTSEDENDCHLTWHCEISPGVLLVAQGNGCIIKVDTREPDSKTNRYKCHTRSMRTLSIHPVTKQHILTSSSTRVAAIWDLRRMSKSLSEISFDKAPSGAFFSPITGNKILTTSYDDNISIYSSTDLSALKLQSKINHCNFTGRWLTNFKAMWHPQREDVFIIGSMQRPRKLEIFHTAEKRSGVLLNVEDEEHFTTVGAVALFHPSVPAVAFGNASGYIHVFD